ncbi:sure-like protein [Auricularia subglabra TFB-10046 SS5]|nr:sure-like protein [Auricularia subglabra TFB-10046 SS5]
MRFTFFILVGAAAHVHALRIVMGNDDGWAASNVRAFFDALDATGKHELILSCPAQDRSGTGSTDKEPTPRDKPCQYDSCPISTEAYGFNATDPRLNWVNSYPVTAVRYGIKDLAPKFWDSAPELVVAGPNIGGNAGDTVLISGTVGAATEANKLGFPAISFSGPSGRQESYTTVPNGYSEVYAALAVRVVEALTTTPGPYLANGTAMNVNFPAVTSECNSVDKFRFVFARVFDAEDGAEDDVKTCGSSRLPTERAALAKGGCIGTVSVYNQDKADVDAEKQAFALNRLKGFLTCIDGSLSCPEKRKKRRLGTSY